MAPTGGPWIDVHAHPGRCFLAGLGEAEVDRILGGSVVALFRQVSG